MASQPGEPARDRGNGHHEVVFCCEPGACGGRIDPQQTLLPSELARLLDFHVWPSEDLFGSVPAARTVCEHVDYEAVHTRWPSLFEQGQQYGAPPVSAFWEARRHLAGIDGNWLCLDVQAESRNDKAALVVYGAGVVGRISDAAWPVVSELLTTNACTLVEPAHDSDPHRPVRPARPLTPHGRPLPPWATPLRRQIGDWVHTWWAYPIGAPPPDSAVDVESRLGAIQAAA